MYDVHLPVIKGLSDSYSESYLHQKCLEKVKLRKKTSLQKLLKCLLSLLGWKNQKMFCVMSHPRSCWLNSVIPKASGAATWMDTLGRSAENIARLHFFVSRLDTASNKRPATCVLFPLCLWGRSSSGGEGALATRRGLSKTAQRLAFPLWVWDSLSLPSLISSLFWTLSGCNVCMLLFGTPNMTLIVGKLLITVNYISPTTLYFPFILTSFIVHRVSTQQFFFFF